MWGDDESDVPHGFVLHARRGALDASFAVVPCETGWYTHFLRGHEALRSNARYVHHESLRELHAWWYIDYDGHDLKNMTVDDMGVASHVQKLMWAE